MKLNRIQIFLAVALLVLASLACNLNLGGPKIPTQVPTPPTEVPPLEDTIQTAVPDGIAGEFKLTVTEAQLTEYIQQELDKQTDPILTDPRVVLRDGVVEIYGHAQSGIVSGNVHLVVEVTIDQQGDPQIKITSADLGGVPVPSALLNVFSNMIQESLTSNISSLATGFRLTEIHIAEGVMVVKGVKR